MAIESNAVHGYERGGLALRGRGRGRGGFENSEATQRSYQSGRGSRGGRGRGGLSERASIIRERAESHEAEGEPNSPSCCCFVAMFVGMAAFGALQHLCALEYHRNKK